jgi:spore coat polysaccharide biosynthesis protein SpsF (cytidylyltransferase family)
MSGKMGIIVVSRLSSTRLPRKAILNIGKKRAIEYVFERAVNTIGVSGVCLATSYFNENSILCDIAKEYGITSYKGSDSDKALRICEAAELCGFDFFVTYDGDDLFVSEELAEIAFDRYKKEHFDFIESDYDLAVGAFSYGFKTSALRTICNLKDSEDTEMVFNFFEAKRDIFNLAKLTDVDRVYYNGKVRATLDYYEDLLFFKNIVENIGVERFTMRDVLNYISCHPEVININFQRNLDWIRNRENHKKVEFKV